MKTTFLVLIFAGLSSFAHAKTRCRNVVDDSIKQQAKFDFPSQNFRVFIPDLKNSNQSRVDTYVLDVVEAADFTRIVARYSITVDETCSVVSGPSLLNN